jgi:large subunit ribosomal protein L22
MIIGKAVVKNTPHSPYKLRPVVNVIRNKSVLFALRYLVSVYRTQKAVPVKKVVYSALANFCNKQGEVVSSMTDEQMKELCFIELKVDGGMTRKYFQPGAQGRAKVMKTRYSHITVVLGKKNEKKERLKG